MRTILQLFFLSRKKSQAFLVCASNPISGYTFRPKLIRHNDIETKLNIFVFLQGDWRRVVRPHRAEGFVHRKGCSPLNPPGAGSCGLHA